jgi:hypothetical protein
MGRYTNHPAILAEATELLFLESEFRNSSNFFHHLSVKFRLKESEEFLKSLPKKTTAVDSTGMAEWLVCLLMRPLT